MFTHHLLPLRCRQLSWLIITWLVISHDPALSIMGILMVCICLKVLYAAIYCWCLSLVMLSWYWKPSYCHASPVKLISWCFKPNSHTALESSACNPPPRPGHPKSLFLFTTIIVIMSSRFLLKKSTRPATWARPYNGLAHLGRCPSQTEGTTSLGYESIHRSKRWFYMCRYESGGWDVVGMYWGWDEIIYLLYVKFYKYTQ